MLRAALAKVHQPRVDAVLSEQEVRSRPDARKKVKLGHFGGSGSSDRNCCCGCFRFLRGRVGGFPAGNLNVCPVLAVLDGQRDQVSHLWLML